MILKKNSTKMRSVLFTVLFILLMASTSVAASYYVDKGHPSSSDSNSGTESNPFKTIQQGVNKAVAGDTVYVKAGTYYEYVDMKNSGTAGNVITIKNYGTDIPIVDGSNNQGSRIFDWKGTGSSKRYIVLDGFMIRNSAKYGVWIEGDYNTIQNCIVADNDVHTGLVVFNASYTTVRHNEVYGSGWNGLDLENSHYSTVEYNYLHHNIHHNGLNMFPETSGPQTMQVGNNIRYNIMAYNDHGAYIRYQQDNEFVNNLIYKNLSNGVYITYRSGQASTYTSNTKFYNNTIVGNGTSGWGNGIHNESAKSIVVKNNIFYANDNYDIYFPSSTTTGSSANHNLYYGGVKIGWGGSNYTSPSSFNSSTGNEANGVSGDPLFVDYAGDDFELNSSSPARNAGISLISQGVTDDYNGTARPQDSMFDIGAFEFGDKTSSQISPPKNLQILPNN